MSQGLVDKQESAMEGRGKSILGSDNGRCKGGSLSGVLENQEGPQGWRGAGEGGGKEMVWERQALFFAVAGP